MYWKRNVANITSKYRLHPLMTKSGQNLIKHYKQSSAVYMAYCTDWYAKLCQNCICFVGFNNNGMKPNVGKYLCKHFLLLWHFYKITISTLISLANHEHNSLVTTKICDRNIIHFFSLSIFDSWMNIIWMSLKLMNLWCISLMIIMLR